MTGVLFPRAARHPGRPGPGLWSHGHRQPFGRFGL